MRRLTPVSNERYDKMCNKDLCCHWNCSIVKAIYLQKVTLELYIILIILVRLVWFWVFFLFFFFFFNIAITNEICYFCQSILWNWYDEASPIIKICKFNFHLNVCRNELRVWNLFWCLKNIAKMIVFFHQSFCRLMLPCLSIHVNH